MKSTTVAIASCLLLSPFAAQAEDWPRWLGAASDSSWNETGLMAEFPAAGPKVKWRAKVSWGYSGPAVAGGKVFLTDYETDGTPDANPGGRTKMEGRERVVCLDSATGRELWKYAWDATYNLSFPAGPRCTPTVDGDHVYSLGAEGFLVCLTTGGKLVWDLDLKKAYQVESPIWGYSAHPLVVGDLVIVKPGGNGTTVVALNKKTGKEVWRGLSSKDVGYAPPVLVNHGGKDQLIIAHGESINSLDPATGKLHWSMPFAPSYGMAIMAPRVSGDNLVMGGMGKKSIGLKLKADLTTPDILWEGTPKTGISPKNSTPVFSGGLLYGCDADGDLRCVDPATGERLWSSTAVLGGSPGSGTFFAVKAAPHWVLFNEKGELILADLTKEGYKEISRAKMLEATSPGMGRKVVWTHPAFAEKCVFLRNDSEVICVSLAAE
jgi:outer membrane protein assembly factor BamB